MVGVGQSTYREWGHTDNTPKTCDHVPNAAAQIFPANGIVVLIRFCACYRCDGMSLRLSDYHSLAISFNEPQQHMRGLAVVFFSCKSLLFGQASPTKRFGHILTGF